ncbi:Hemolysin-type calcium-binding [Seminavis robusta]|uniref:Hemolysin-type calcium-binding n=1 Tax=Seminavis robusta TaxID=568900 RepID=A0A9N8E0L0_9STRA|nr:Hemolysin-type calcium-binding [Seminavis robusta]|eukprot:Sro529_g160970.1 Hemolysin-type calcium-binding (557) ;mRNA; r:18038-19708
MTMSLLSILCVLLAAASAETTESRALRVSSSGAVYRPLTLRGDAMSRSLQGGVQLSSKVPLNLTQAAIYLGNGLNGSSASLVDGVVALQSDTLAGAQAVCAYDVDLSFVIDMGAIYRVSDITVWHNWQGAPRRHCAQKIELSTDGFVDSSVTVFETGPTGYGPLETSQGNQIALDTPVHARYIRHQAGRSNVSQQVSFNEIEVTVQPNDFDWGLAAGAPLVSVQRGNATNENNIRFNFTVGDSRPVYKQFKTTLLAADCTSTVPADERALAISFDDSAAMELFVTVAIDESELATSPFWTSPSGSSGTGIIGFCLLVEYCLTHPNTEQHVATMSFLQTAVALSVNLEASFAIQGIRTQLDSHDVWTNVDYNYNVQARLCSSDGSDVEPTTNFTQGSTVSLCISTAADVPGYVSVSHIEELVMKQQGGSVMVTLIYNSEDTFLTLTTCTDGECRVEIQLPTVFFVTDPLRNLEVSGVAILELGEDESGNGTRRRVRQQRTEDQTLPETSTGFTAKVYISYGDEEEEFVAGAESGCSVLSSSTIVMIWTGIVALLCLR